MDYTTHFPGFLATLTPSTARSYASVLRAYFQRMSATVFSPEAIQMFLDQCRAGGMAVGYYNSHLAALRGFLRYLVDHGLAPERDMTRVAFIKMLPIPQPTNPYITPVQLTAITDAIDLASVTGLRDMAFMRLLSSTGLRHTEIMAVDIPDLDIPARTVIVRGTADQERIVSFTDATADALYAYLRDRNNPTDGPLWLNVRGDRVTGRTMARMLEKYTEGLGFSVSMHGFRQTHVQVLSTQGTNEPQIQAVFGYRAARTAARYLPQYDTPANAE